MVLQLEYRNGDARKINLHPSFFEGTIAFKQGKQVVLTPESKAHDLAYIYGENPYKIVISKGGDIYYSRVFPGNNPKENVLEAYPNDKDLRHKLRRQFKQVPFTMKWKLGEKAPVKILA